MPVFKNLRSTALPKVPVPPVISKVLELNIFIPLFINRHDQFYSPVECPTLP
jgi:hypothetical protein